MIQNKLKVLIQRARVAGYRPAKILLPVAWRDMLREEMRGSALYVRGHETRDDKFAGIPVVARPGLREPMIQLESENIDGN